jgi:ABC-type taurine transport system ATPase subunit
MPLYKPSNVADNVIDNVAFPLELQGVTKSERMDRAHHFIDMVGLCQNRDATLVIKWNSCVVGAKA